MKIFILNIILILLVTTSCNKSQLKSERSSTLLLSIENLSGSTDALIIKKDPLSNSDSIINKVTIEENVISKISTEIDRPSYVYLKIDSVELPLFLFAGEQKVSSNSLSLIDSLKIEGEGGEVNRFITMLNRNNNKIYQSDNLPFFRMSENDFLNHIESISSLFSNLKSQVTTSETDVSFKQMIDDISRIKIISIVFNYNLVNYGSYNQSDYDSFHDEVFFYNDYLDYSYSDYLSAIRSKFNYNYYSKYFDDVDPESFDSINNILPLILMEEVDKLSVEPNVKEYFHAVNIYDHVSYGSISPSVEEALKYFVKSNPNSNYINTISKSFNKIGERFSKGSRLPDLRTLNSENDTIHVSDIYGRPMMIDIWATWCKPCIEEFPSMSKLIKRYGDDIDFVFISVDSNREKWRDRMSLYEKKYDLNGIQLIEAFDGEIYQKLGLSGVPRYILLDSQAKIMNFKAPSPSSESILSEIEDLLESK